MEFSPAIVVLAAVALAALTYLGLERLGRRAWLPLALRAVAWSALGLLLLNISCPVRGATERPLVLLDGSLSMRAAGGRWAEARDSARRLGDVQLFGDERPGGAAGSDSTADSAAVRGRSLLLPALTAAAGASRPVVVVTDGEIEDAPDLPRDLLARTGVRLFPRAVRRDIAIVGVSGPARVTAGDTARVDVELRVIGDSAPDSVAVEARLDRTRLARRTVALSGGGARLALRIPGAALPAGDNLIRVELAEVAAGDDAEPRTDARLLLVTATPTPGVVLLAAPPDWDSRFLYRALRDVAQLPVRGYARIAGNRWRSMSDLAVVSEAQVREAARRADLLVVKGEPGGVERGSGARGVWLWPSGEGGETLIPGDWYLSAGSSSPVAGAFLGLPLDSLPPATRLTPVQPADDDWVALTAQEGRRGAQRPAVVGREEGRTRRVTVAVDGLWRWAFRGGSSEQAYRSWVAATASWLLGGADSARGRARALRPVVQNGRPVVFEWVGNGSPEPVAIALSGPAGMRSDTLQFDGAGRASLRLPVGAYRYRLDGGGAGTVAVEEYSDEFVPRPVALQDQPVAAVQSSARSPARDWLWLFGICVLALSGEWLTRRRLGLR